MDSKPRRTFTRSPYYRDWAAREAGVAQGLFYSPFVMWSGQPGDLAAGWFPCNGWVDYYTSTGKGLS